MICKQILGKPKVELLQENKNGLLGKPSVLLLNIVQILTLKLVQVQKDQL